MKKSFKMFFLSVISVFLISTASCIAINVSIVNKSEDFIYRDLEKVPDSQVVIVLGAKVYENGQMTDMLHDRVDTGLELYESGKAEKLLLSGDHGQKNYDEVNAMKKYVLEKSIPEENKFAQKYKKFQELMKQSNKVRLLKACDLLDNLGSLPYRKDRGRRFFRHVREAREMYLPLAKSVNTYIASKMEKIIKTLPKLKD